MIAKTFASLERVLADLADGATIMIGGFGNVGMPSNLTNVFLDQGARQLTVVNNNARKGKRVSLRLAVKRNCNCRLAPFRERKTLSFLRRLGGGKAPVGIIFDGACRRGQKRTNEMDLASNIG